MSKPVRKLQYNEATESVLREVLAEMGVQIPEDSNRSSLWKLYKASTVKEEPPPVEEVPEPLIVSDEIAVESMTISLSKTLDEILEIEEEDLVTVKEVSDKEMLRGIAVVFKDFPLMPVRKLVIQYATHNRLDLIDGEYLKVLSRIGNAQSRGPNFRRETHGLFVLAVEALGALKRGDRLRAMEKYQDMIEGLRELDRSLPEKSRAAWTSLIAEDEDE